MSRRSVWSPLPAALVVLLLSACRADSPVAPEPEAVETAGDAQPQAKARKPFRTSTSSYSVTTGRSPLAWRRSWAPTSDSR